MQMVESKSDKIVWGVAGVACFLIIGLLTWGGSKLVAIGEDNAGMKVQLGSMEQAISQVQATIAAGTADRYTGTAAAQDRAAMLELIKQNSDWNRKQDDSLRDLEIWRARQEGKP